MASNILLLASKKCFLTSQGLVGVGMRGAVKVVFRWYINKVVNYMYVLHHHCLGVRLSVL
jgi:hypothetical protein